MRQDLKLAFRVLLRNPVLSLVVLLTMALGIGVNAAVFSVVDYVLLRPLPYPHAERLVRVWGADKKRGQRFLELSFRDFEALRDQARSFDLVACFSVAPRRLADAGERPIRVSVARVSSQFLKLLGTSLELGRPISEEESRRQERLAILSHQIWQGRYGGQPEILGRTVDINDEGYQVVGVLPADWEYPKGADIWRPLREDEMEQEDREFFVLARKRPGVSDQDAAVEAAALIERQADRHPQTQGLYTAWVEPMQSMLVSDARTPLLVLLVAVGIVLLVICVNLANLMLARSSARMPEMAVRAALGAGPGRLSRQLLTESLVLAAAGGLLGIGVGYVTLQALTAMAPADIPRLSAVSLDVRVTAVTALATLVCGLLFGLAPALMVSRPDLRSGLSSARGSSKGAAGLLLRRALVVAEISVSVILVIGAGLLIASFQRMLDFDRGFHERHLLEIPTSISFRDYPGTESQADLYDRVSSRLQTIAGVETVEMASFSPMNPRGLRLPVQVEGLDLPPDRSTAQMRVVSAGYFRLIGLPVLQGRSFSPSDRASGKKVVLVNKAFAQAFFPGGEISGKRLLLPSLSQGGDIVPYQVIGMVDDLRPAIDSQPAPAFYYLFEQEPWSSMNLTLMRPGDPSQAALLARDQIWSEASNVTIDRIRTLQSEVSRTLAAPRFSVTLVGTFAALTLFLAAFGLYGVVSYSVSQQTRELAIRRALGASEQGILFLVMRQGLWLGLAGIALGIPMALGFSRLLATQLFEITPAHLPTYLLTAFLLLAVCLLACWIPARRSLGIDPVTALHEE